MTWLDYVDDGAPSVAAFASWLSQLHPSVRRDLVVKIDALRALAAAGDIVISGDDAVDQLAAIRADPDLYELRWTLLTKVVRQYHGEPPEDGDLLVALHMHIKGDTTLLRRGGQRRISNQPAEIARAVRRYRDGHESAWTTDRG